MFDLLRGLRIVDLTTVVLGPYATQVLADFGAEVIKVEPPAGDVFRAARPGRAPDVGAPFQNFNRNKRSLTLDLKREQGREVLHRLVEKCDVFVHNMRSRSAEDLGAGYDTLREVKPDLVYCYSAGFGDEGPDRDAPAYDDIIQARSGIAFLNADAEGAPQFVRTLIGDKTVGLHLALAVLGGVVHRERTGQGVCISAPMLESMTAFALAEHLAGHSFEPTEGEMGYSRLMSANRRPYPTKDGYIALLPYSTKHWIRFFEASSTPAMASDSRVTDPVRRSEAIDELYEMVAAEAATRTTDEWLDLLGELDVPCARVNRLGDLPTDPHLEAVGAFEEVDGGALGPLRQLRSPFAVNGQASQQAAPDTGAARLGAHTREILQEAGYAPAEIDAMLESGLATAPEL